MDEHVLLVEDDPSIQEIASLGLELSLIHI